MAIISMPQAKRLQIKVQTGYGTSGAAIYSLRNFYNVKPAAAAADLYAVGQSLAGLQSHTASAILTVATDNLTDDGN